MVVGRGNVNQRGRTERGPEASVSRASQAYAAPWQFECLTLRTACAGHGN